MLTDAGLRPRLAAGFSLIGNLCAYFSMRPLAYKLRLLCLANVAPLLGMETLSRDLFFTAFIAANTSTPGWHEDKSCAGLGPLPQFHVSLSWALWQRMDYLLCSLSPA